MQKRENLLTYAFSSLPSSSSSSHDERMDKALIIKKKLMKYVLSVGLLLPKQRSFLAQLLKLRLLFGLCVAKPLRCPVLLFCAVCVATRTSLQWREQWK